MDVRFWVVAVEWLWLDASGLWNISVGKLDVVLLFVGVVRWTVSVA